MAYIPANLALIAQNVGGGKRHFLLTGTDAITSVVGASYITDGVDKGMRAGDYLTYVKTDTSDRFELAVLSVSSTAATVGGIATILGAVTSTPIGFYGTAPIAQRTSAAQAAVATTAPVSSGAFGFSSTQATALIALTNELRAAMVALGLIKGS
jgi:hypothetical protein